MPPPKRKPKPQPEPEPPGRTVTVTTARRSVRAVHAGGQIFPIGEPVTNVPAQTVQALEAMPGITVDVAGTPDVDTPAPPPPQE